MNLNAVNDFVGKDWVYIKNDCWTVFRRASLAVFGVYIREISVPAVSNHAYNKGLFERGAMRDEWAKIEKPADGCAVLFNDRRGRPVHIGLHVTKGNVLHCLGSPKRAGKTVYEPLYELKKIFKTIEFYEYLPDNHS